MSVTFDVSPKVVPGHTKHISVDTFTAIKSAIKIRPEAANANFPDVISSQKNKKHGFIDAVHIAFDRHYPLILSPDDVWLTIAQGFAQHVNTNAERLRKHFVKHKGKVYIEIRRDNFVKGSANNDWQSGFSEFSDKIAEHIGKKRDLLVSKFTTTGPVEKAASELVLMDAMKSYFEYGCATCCGIPNITLTGDISDWVSVRERALNLTEYDCKEWITVLTPVLDQFVSAFRGNADPKFWQSFYKTDSSSGGPYVTGAINTLFPYLKRGEVNKTMFEWEKFNSFGGPGMNDFASGLSSVPFKWNYFNMQFIGGFVGAHQDAENFSVRPAIGWGVSDV